MINNPCERRIFKRKLIYENHKIYSKASKQKGKHIHKNATER
jgi:hypothetical protein